MRLHNPKPADVVGQSGNPNASASSASLGASPAEGGTNQNYGREFKPVVSNGARTWDIQNTPDSHTIYRSHDPTHHRTDDPVKPQNGTALPFHPIAVGRMAPTTAQRITQPSPLPGAGHNAVNPNGKTIIGDNPVYANGSNGGGVQQ